VGLEDVSGSGQRVAQLDTALIVNGTKVDGRVTSARVTFEKLREEPDEYPLPAEFAIERDAAGVPRLMQSTGSSAPGADDGRPLTERILCLLMELGPLPKSALRDHTGRNGPAIEQALTELFAARAIATDEKTVRGKPTKHYKLTAKAENLAGLLAGPSESKDLAGPGRTR
jgi:hypothetical protein